MIISHPIQFFSVLTCLSFVVASFTLAEDLSNRAELAKQADAKFDAMDTDKDGKISLSEYSKDCVAKGMSETTHAAQIAQGFKSVDGDKDGNLSYGEIVGTVLWVDADTKRKIWDKNNDNFLSAEEFVAGQKKTDTEALAKKFVEIDADKDGNASTSELFMNNKNIWLKKPGSIDRKKSGDQ